MGSPLRCCKCKRWGSTEKAHVVRKMMGGRRQGRSGPTVRLCPACHDDVDEHGNKTMAVRKEDHAFVWLERDGELVSEVCVLL